MFKQISIIGLGYIGLPTAAILAQQGKMVYGMDINAHWIERIQQGDIPNIEPDLAEMVKSAVQSGRLLTSTQAQPADAFVIAVPTPINTDLSPDLSYLEQAVKYIAPLLQVGNLVLVESTVPVGTTEKVAEWLKMERPDLVFPDLLNPQTVADIHIAYCPERVLPSQMLRELVQNDRIIGGLTPACAKSAVDFYRIFVQGQCIATQARLAEMCKLTENSFRDVNIAFANELSLICDQLDLDVWELIRLANHHPRVNILQPSAGVGGHCIAVDPWFIVAQSPAQAKLIRCAREVNDHKPEWVIEKAKSTIAEAIMAKNCRPDEISVACLGLAFKPDVDDLRESPALKIVSTLSQWHQGEFLLVEPHIQHLPSDLAKRAKLVDFHTALQADVLILLVGHKLFRDFTDTAAFSLLSQKSCFDACGIWTTKWQSH
ncbi:UDP-N-acetyl-D-mannosaminuronic acid dehydrogenase [Pasteurellaceae bacterium Pebbles2]|nr:UDP-N-acetyl-D-mannosaminuronic acid dehydrogenase [Pasteurellaceae bacterium Pebbles2]